MDILNHLLNNSFLFNIFIVMLIGLPITFLLITLTEKYPDIFFKILAVGVIIGTILLFILKLAIIAIAIIILFFVALVKLNNN